MDVCNTCWQAMLDLRRAAAGASGTKLSLCCWVLLTPFPFTTYTLYTPLPPTQHCSSSSPHLCCWHCRPESVWQADTQLLIRHLQHTPQQLHANNQALCVCGRVM